MHAQYISSGQNSFVTDNNGTKLFCPRFCPGDKNHTFFLGRPSSRGWRQRSTMRSPASGCRLLPPLPIILPPPQWVQVTTTTTTMKQTSHRRERGWTPMGEGDNNPMTAWENGIWLFFQNVITFITADLFVLWVCHRPWPYGGKHSSLKAAIS